MKTKNQNETLNLYDCSAIKIKKNKVNDIGNGIYVYYIQKWNAEGYRNINELKYFVINVETKEILNENISERFIIDAFNYGDDYPEIKYGLNNFDIIINSMNELKEKVMFDFSSFDIQFIDQNKIICERNIQYLDRTFERKIMSINQQIEKARQNGQPERVIRMNEGKLLKTEETFSIQKKKLELKITGRCTSSDIAVGIIRVEE